MAGNDDNSSDSVKIAIISTKLDNLTESFDRFDQKISQRYVTREEHITIVGELTGRIETLEQKLAPLQKIVYGMVAIILTGVLGAVLSGVFK